MDQLRKTYYGVHEGKKIREVELSKLLPNQTLLEEAYPTMLDMHCVDNERDADKSDYLSKMESLGWLSYIGAALRTATDVCEMLGRCFLLVCIKKARFIHYMHITYPSIYPTSCTFYVLPMSIFLF